MLYPVAIYQKDRIFFAKVPDLPAIDVQGASMADVLGNARLAIIEHLQGLWEQGLPLVDGQNIGVHLNNPDFFGYTWAMIGLDSVRFAQKTVNYHLPMPQETMDNIYRQLGDKASVEGVRSFILQAINAALQTDASA